MKNVHHAITDEGTAIFVSLREKNTNGVPILFLDMGCNSQRHLLLSTPRSPMFHIKTTVAAALGSARP